VWSAADESRACFVWSVKRKRDGRRIELSFGMWCDACCGP
jgi:hypothetical protein